jgi:DNA modification methylase/predicted RNA-binding Zn-ribbon protein involved in translation (DUF1610 family)
MAKIQQLSFRFPETTSQQIFLDKPRLLQELANNTYTPFKNEHLREFVTANLSPNGEDNIEPFPENLTSGKNTYVYDAHTYHTKVPPEAIERLISHYSAPGEIVLDPFCGSGMTGVAALRLQRKPILIDLSPAATFIASNFLTPVVVNKYTDAIKQTLANARDVEIRLYGTHCRTCGKLVPIEYMVWSYGLLCSFCQKEFVLWNVARDERENVRESKIKTEFDCPHCGRHLIKRVLKRTRLYPVQVGYRCCASGTKEATAIPDEYDLEAIRRSEAEDIPASLWFPQTRLPMGVNTRQAIAHGIESVDALYTKRNLFAVAMLWDLARKWPETEMSQKLMFTVTSLYQRVTRLSEFRFWGGSGNIANYNVPMIFNEQNVFKVFYRKAKTIQFYLETWPSPPNPEFCISTQSATDFSAIPDNTIDYVFTDPPFGSNINYSEMNFIWEAWLGIFTDTKPEAIINRFQEKSIESYRELMTQAFQEIHRVLKPGRWLTIVFHNSSAKVWAAIQKAISASGFKVERIQTLDKRHGTFKQFVSDNTVGYDLMLHCKKDVSIIIDESGISRLSQQATSYTAIRTFLNQVFTRGGVNNLIIQYLHVNRKSDLDTRKLYSMWLKETMESGKIVDMSYDEFRKTAMLIVQKDFPSLLEME